VSNQKYTVLIGVNQCPIFLVAAKGRAVNLIGENSCLFVVIPYIFSLCRSLSAVLSGVAQAKSEAFVKADGFVAMR